MKAYVELKDVTGTVYEGPAEEATPQEFEAVQKLMEDTMMHAHEAVVTLQVGDDTLYFNADQLIYATIRKVVY